jgi:subtilisin family serine protease
LIKKCIKAGVIVVAAMGDYQSDMPVYPAATEGVIAVGATNPRDGHTTNSNSGSHVLIGAPGEGILTLHGDQSYKRQDGTSFAAPMVSAAAWLALRHRPEWEQADLFELFRKSVHVPGRRHDPHIGYGRLDMKRLADLVSAHG